MKKFFVLIGMLLMVMLPLNAKAASSLAVNYKCGGADAEGNIKCTMTYLITGDGFDNINITLTEKGGAQIQKIEAVPGSDWEFNGTPSESNSVWTVRLTSPGVSGEGDLFSFTYKASGEKDCQIEIGKPDGSKTTITPSVTPDTPTDNKDTGSALPFVALTTITLVAVGAYFATRNKTKMYKI